MQLATEFLFEMKAGLAAPLEVGNTPYGRRRVIPVTGGTFEGPKGKGTVVPGGADWQVIRADGVTEVMALYELKADDGTLIHVTNKGLRHGPDAVIQRLMRGEEVDPSEYYFRTNPVFEAPTGKWDWLNRSMFLASGARYAAEVRIRFFQVL